MYGTDFPYLYVFEIVLKLTLASVQQTMYVYTVIYPSVKTNTCYIRHFTSDLAITEGQYKALVSMKGDIAFEFHCWGEVKSFQVQSLFEGSPNSTFSFQHDFELPLAKKEEYLTFVKEMVDMERKRPTFSFQKEETLKKMEWERPFAGSFSTITEVVAWTPEGPFDPAYETTDSIRDFSQMAKGTWISKECYDYWNGVPQVLFACNFFSEECTSFCSIWQSLTSMSGVEFRLLPSTSEYRVCELPKEFTKPHIFWRTGSTWTPYTGDMTLGGLQDLVKTLQKHDATILHELSNGKVIKETNDILTSCIGTSVFPDLHILTTLTQKKGKLIQQRGFERKEIAISKEQTIALEAIFATGTFSLEHCFGLWEPKKTQTGISESYENQKRIDLFPIANPYWKV